MKYAAVTTVLLIALLTAHTQAAEYHWQRDADKSVALMRGDQIIWQFHYASGQTKPYFHPVALPGGPTLTERAPADHPWHYALWFSWKYINKVNYWEEDRKTGLPDGRTSWSNVHVDTRDDHSATITMDLSYHTPNAPPVVIEHRTITISAPRTNGVYHLNWTSKFTAKQDALLDRTPRHGPEGKVWGGYAGLSVRFNNAMAERECATAVGPVQFDGVRAWPHAMAADYSGRIAGKLVGIAALDHPDNPRSPTPWYLIRSDTMSYMNAALLADDALPLKAGQSMTLNYRMIVHPERLTAEQLQAACSDWLQ